MPWVPIWTRGCQRAPASQHRAHRPARVAHSGCTAGPRVGLADGTGSGEAPSRTGPRGLASAPSVSRIQPHVSQPPVSPPRAPAPCLMSSGSSLRSAIVMRAQDESHRAGRSSTPVDWPAAALPTERLELAATCTCAESCWRKHLCNTATLHTPRRAGRCTTCWQEHVCACSRSRVSLAPVSEGGVRERSSSGRQRGAQICATALSWN